MNFYRLGKVGDFLGGVGIFILALAVCAFIYLTYLNPSSNQPTPLEKTLNKLSPKDSISGSGLISDKNKVRKK